MKKIFGDSWRTTLTGYAIAGLIIVQDMTSAGETNYFKIGLAVLIGVLGRVAGDSQQVKEGDNKKF